jgi:hypothetical protein
MPIAECSVAAGGMQVCLASVAAGLTLLRRRCMEAERLLSLFGVMTCGDHDYTIPDVLIERIELICGGVLRVRR